MNTNKKKARKPSEFDKDSSVLLLTRDIRPILIIRSDWDCKEARRLAKWLNKACDYLENRK